MKILGIETSCDETAAAIVEDGTKILASTVASSQELHKKTGGIIPEVAAREQIKCIIPVIEETLKNSYLVARATSSPPRGESSGQAMKNIDALAVTIGPGLIGSLLVGVETAKTIAYITEKPIIPVNHIFAHIYANWLRSPGRSPSGHLPGVEVPQFPVIALVVSGGHTELFLMKGHGDLKWLGGTRDDAAGEAFDKTARLLGLGYPGGPAIAAAAAKFKVQPCDSAQGKSAKCKVRLPRPMINEDSLDFSFSGLKTAVMREVNKLKQSSISNLSNNPNLPNNITRYLAYEIQEAITDVLVEKTLRAAEKYKVKSILLGGGVAANQRLAEKMKLKIENLKLKINLHIPPPNLCTDNAAYIASYAYFNYQPIPWQKIQAKPNLEVEV